MMLWQSNSKEHFGSVRVAKSTLCHRVVQVTRKSEWIFGCAPILIRSAQEFSFDRAGGHHVSGAVKGSAERCDTQILSDSHLPQPSIHGLYSSGTRRVD